MEIKEELIKAVNETIESATIKEAVINSQYRNSVKDYTFEVSTGIAGTASHITPIINGELCALIFSSNKSVNVQVTLNSPSTIVIFDNKNNMLPSDIYIPIRVRGISPDYEGFNYSQEYFYLNDKLRFEFTGQYEATIKVTVRYM